jgi:predicted transcriptional regulator
MKPIDAIDCALMTVISTNPGSSISDVIGSLLKTRSENALRYRIRSLNTHEFIILKRTKSKTLCYPGPNLVTTLPQE